MYVITGATGNVGARVAESLLAAGKQVRAIARHADKLQVLADKGAEIRVGSASDIDFLADAYKGATAIMTMLVTDFTTPDVKTYQQTMKDSIARAVQSSGTRYVVNISSMGGHTTEHSGIVAGIAFLEREFNQMSDINILHLRPTYFMENHLGNIGMIKQMGINGSPIRGDIKIPLIATPDIAEIAAKRLLALDFTGHSALPLLGAANVTMEEFTKALGAAIGRPDLPYVAFPYDQAKAGMTQHGISPSVADALIALSDSVNKGLFEEQRTAENTTPTTIEDFARTVFAPIFNAA